MLSLVKCELTALVELTTNRPRVVKLSWLQNAYPHPHLSGAEERVAIFTSK